MDEVGNVLKVYGKARFAFPLGRMKKADRVGMLPLDIENS